LKILVIASWKSDFFDREARAIKSHYDYKVDLVFLKRDEKNFYKEILYLFVKNILTNLELVEDIKNKTVNYYVSNSNNRIKRYLLKWINRRKFNSIKRQNYDLIHLQSLNPAALLYYDLQYVFVNTPVIFTEHNQFGFKGLDLIDQKKIIKVVKRANRRLVVSKDKIRQFAANGIHEDFFVIGNCIDGVYSMENAELERNSLGILHVGAFDPYKDQETLFEALKLLDRELFGSNVKVDFTWIGYNGWGVVSDNAVNNFVSDYSFENISVYVEPFTHDLEALKEKYQANGLYVLSSVSEGLSVAMLEAMACGMYVISTRCGGSEDVITDENGVLVPIKDSYNLARAMHSYILNRYAINRSKISENILNDFNINTFVYRLKEQYDCAIQMNQ
jgi:glycosyltransferase involved in cell wall biosynthesis